MSTITTQEREFFFSEPRLQMTTVGRSIVRLAARVGCGIVIAAAAVFTFFTDVPQLHSLGVLLFLFLFHRIWRYMHPRYRLNVPLPRKVNVAHYLSPQSYRMIEIAYERTVLTGGDFFLHLASRLAHNKDVQGELLRLDVRVEELVKKIDSRLHSTPFSKPSREELLEDIRHLAISGLEIALQSGGSRIQPHELFAALAMIGHGELNNLFGLYDITHDDLRAVFVATHARKRMRGVRARSRRTKGIGARPSRVKHHVMNRAWTARPTPILDQFSVDFTDLARAGGISPLVGHADQYARLVDVLARPGNPHALIISDSAHEMEAIVGELALQVVLGNVPPPLYDHRLVSISVGGLVAGTGEGELERRMKILVDEIKGAGNIIAFIPDIHNLMRTSGKFKISAADVFIPAIRHNDFSVIGSTFPREFKQYLDVDHKFVEAFEIIRVPEITTDDAIRLLVMRSIVLEMGYRVRISLRAIKESVELAKKYLREKLLPESADDLLNEAVVAVVEQKKDVVTAQDIIDLVEKKVGIPIHKAKEEETAQLLNLEQIIHERYIDQEEAVGAVAQSLREYRAGLARKGGPIASFLFVGPTGVGKTELAKLLAEFQFGSESMMLRFDMSEFQTQKSIVRLIGSAGGDAQGALTTAVREKPYSLVLLDEFEKAHTDILNLFLQVLDDGRLTDALERTIDFTNTIIIATSNAHSDIINDALSKSESMDQISEYLKRRLVDVFKPELLNRFSRIIAFKNLLPKDIRAIAKIKLDVLKNRLREEQGISFVFDEEIVEQIAQIGFDPLFGARPLRKAIDNQFRGKLAELILRKELSRGDTISVHVKDGTFTFDVTKSE